MSRATPRRKVYCDAVRVLDCSLPREWNADQTTARHESLASLDLDKLYKKIVVWRTKFPQLSQVLHKHPIKEIYDSYTVKIDGKAISVDIESRKIVQLYADEIPSHDSLLLPYPAPHKHLSVRHTIIVNCERDFLHYHSARKATLEAAWCKWLYADPPNDHRITHVNISPESIPAAIDEYITLLTATQRERPPHITPTITDLLDFMPISLDDLARIAPLMGTSIRHLSVFPGLCLRNEYNEWTAMLSLLDRYFPRLEVLRIFHLNYSPCFPSPENLVHSCPNLRSFDFEVELLDDAVMMAQALASVGSPQCVYYSGRVAGQGGNRHALQDLVRVAKSKGVEAARLFWEDTLAEQGTSRN